MKKSKQTKKKPVRTLYLRNVSIENYAFIKEQSEVRGYCPSTVLNRIIDFVQKETDLQML